VSESTVAAAMCRDFRDGRRIWVPPTGKPFWAHCSPTVNLTDEEIRRYLPDLIDQKEAQS